MSKPRKIFLSHSSLDGVLATLLEAEMKRELGDGFTVFRSTRADAINSGEQWFNVIRQEMDEADALVVLITETAKNSAWVGFELGYFWRKENIHALYHPRVALPSPFSILQSKKLTVRDELHNFFKTLCDKLGVTYEAKADVDAIIALANQIVIMPVEDKSLGKFIEYLENSEWEISRKENDITKDEPSLSFEFTCQNNVDYKIIIERSYTDWVSLFKQDKLHIAFDVMLKIRDNIFRKLLFNGSWESQHLTPSPKQDDAQNWYLSRNSLEIKIARVIAQFNGVRPKTSEEFDRELEKFANQYGIAIVD